MILDQVKGCDFANLKTMFEMGHSVFLSEGAAGRLREVARVLGVGVLREEEEVEETEVQPQQATPSGDLQVTRLMNNIYLGKK